MGYKQLTYKERCQIYGLWRSGHKQSEIAKEVGVDKSTIGREIQRNSRWNGYYPEQAQAYADSRRKNAKKHKKFTDEVKSFVKEKIELDWSPDQISGYAKRHNLFSISHERIYQYILLDKKHGGELYTHLRHQSKKYRKRYGSPARKGSIKNRVSIELRPAVVEEKSRIGDWEIDTIIGKNRKQAIVSIVERVSKITILKKVERKTAELVEKATVEGLKDMNAIVLTITSDNGSDITSIFKTNQTNK